MPGAHVLATPGGALAARQPASAPPHPAPLRRDRLA